MKKRILAFGNPVYDRIMTPQITRTDRVLSGCSTNACLAAAKLGEEAVLVGTVGQDFRSRLEKDLLSRGVRHHLFPAAQTGGFSLIYYDEHGNRELTVLGVADAIPATMDGYSAYDFILIGPILGEVNLDLLAHLQQNSSAPILFDPQGSLRQQVDGKIVHSLTDVFIQTAKMSTVVKANELETQVVTGIAPRDAPEKAVKVLHKYGAKISIVTLAEAGSIIYDGTTFTVIPPYTTDAIDPTGAGDTYAGGFMVKYLETPGDLRAVGCFASSVASVMVENSGPDFPLTRAEADRRMQILLNRPQKLVL